MRVVVDVFKWDEENALKIGRLEAIDLCCLVIHAIQISKFP